MGSGQNLIYGNTAASPQGNLLLLQVNEVDKFEVEANGNTTIAGNLTVNGSLSVGSGGSYIGYPTDIKETTPGNDPDGKHNADFTDQTGARNGWNGLKIFANGNGCSAPEWHVCQGWEVAYLFLNDSFGTISDGCDTTTNYTGDTVSDVCLGWVIGPIAESTIETESGFMEAGDCYGYKSAATDVYHSAVWYIDQWGAATCSSLLPVLCCK